MTGRSRDTQGGLFGSETGGGTPGAPGPDAPLAERMRPLDLDGLVGQSKLLGKGAPLRRAIEEDRLHSMILWGPPGSGKTTLAQLVARTTSAEFVQLSAVMASVKEAREIMNEAVERRKRMGRRTVLFIDEIHRYNKAQQDAFLPFVERGDVVLIGATTENPSFGVIGPLLSRARVHVLQAHAEADVKALLSRALGEDVILGPRGLALADEAASLITAHASGDARVALGLLEVTATSLPEGVSLITEEHVRAAAESRMFLHDKAGERHFDTISAFIKSMRNSDPDASIYWMVRMLEAGEDPLFILRRMVILAAEDIGLADPRALMVAVAAQQAFERLGSPEGQIPMAQACLYLATAPKSNAAYLALGAARAAVTSGIAEPVPLHLRNAVTGLLRNEGYGAGYRYAHDEPGGVAEAMDCLPPSLAGTRFYEPTERGAEAAIRKRLEWARGAPEPPGAEAP